jgi:mycofactocin glycosyltransferase
MIPAGWKWADRNRVSANEPAPVSQPLPPEFRVAADPATRRLDEGTSLMGGSPLRLIRLSARGRDALDRLLGGATVGEAGPGAGLLARHLVEAGMLQPRPPASSVGPDDVAVVIPVRDRAAALARAVDAVRPAGKVIVVDDGSCDASGQVAAEAGAEVVRRDVPGGPAAARNAGLAAAAAPIVAFVDSDCEPQPGWLDRVLPHFADPAVGAVAPRITGPPRPRGAVARYEHVRSPLDLGAGEGPVRPRSRVAYLPAAALVVRRDAVTALGGFDEALHYGEDVDLVWRLVAAGWSVRFEPAATVQHQHRTRLRYFAARRAAYGSSAAALARRHPDALTPLQVSAWSAAAWALTAGGKPVVGVGVTAVSTALLPLKLGDLHHPWRESLRIAGRGHLGAGRLIADAIMRTWLPLAVVAAMVSRRGRRVLAAAALVPAASEWRARRPGLDPIRYVALRALDDAAYCAGVWTGCLREHTIRPLLPDLANWPGRRRAAEDLP